MITLDDLIVLTMVLLAAAYLARGLWRRLHPRAAGSSAAGCGGCNGCSAAAPDARACGAPPPKPH